MLDFMGLEGMRGLRGLRRPRKVRARRCGACTQNSKLKLRLRELKKLTGKRELRGAEKEP